MPVIPFWDWGLKKLRQKGKLLSHVVAESGLMHAQRVAGTVLTTNAIFHYYRNISGESNIPPHRWSFPP